MSQRPPAPCRPYWLPLGATARRPTWAMLPTAVRELIERRLGQPVIGAESQGGGFTNGFASRLVAADGSRAFVKAASPTIAPEIFPSYRQEVLVAAALPCDVPTPRLLWSAEAGEWLAFAFEDVPGTIPERPWQPEQLAVVLDTLTQAARALTPAPPGLAHLKTAADLDEDFRYWRCAAAGEGDALRLVPEAWRERVDALADREATWARKAAGDTAAHFDMRDDNLLLTPDGRAVVCDWNWMTLAAPWVDLVSLLVSVHGDGLDAEAALVRHPLSAGVPGDAVDALLVALAGSFIRYAARPPVPQSPWIREHLAWWRDATLSWLCLRLRGDAAP